MATLDSPTLYSTPPGERQTERELLAVFDIYRFSGPQLGQILVSPDNRHIAFVDQGDSDWWRVTLDQNLGTLYPGILSGSLTFSPDSQRFAYAVVDTRGQYVVADDEVWGPYRGVISGSPVFSPDSQQIAYAAHVHNKKRISVFLDQALVGTCSKIGDTLQFSPDGASLAWKAAIGKAQCVMVNGQEGPFYEQVDNPHFSPDGRRMAYMAKQNGQWFVVVDGEEGPRFKNAVTPTFSPDSQRVAYYAKGEDGWYIIDGGQRHGPYYAFARGELYTYSPDSERLAFIGVEAKRWLRIPYHFRERVVADGEVGRRYQKCCSLVFSPDSQHLAYAAKQDKQWSVVLDGQLFGPYQALEEDGPCFSPDSQQLGYAAVQNGRWSPYVNGRPAGAYDLAWRPTFAPDSRSYAAVISNKGQGAALVINGALVEPFYDGIFIKRGGARIVYNDPHTLHYIANPTDARDHWYLVIETFV